MKTAIELIAFERRIADLWEAGELPFLTHLSGGNERVLVELFNQEVNEGDWIFSSHRNHYHALLSGITESRLEQLIRAGNSMFVFSRERNFVSSAILGGTAGMAAGAALALKMTGSNNRAWCFLGDGAIENGHTYEAALFVDAQDLPCVFVVEDNNRQVDTPVSARRGGREWLDNPLSNFRCVRRYIYQPTFPHAGSGCAHQIKFH